MLVEILTKNQNIKNKLGELELDLQKYPEGIDSSTFRTMMKKIKEIEEQNEPEKKTTPTDTGDLEDI